jgi:hypothetical protein
MSIGSTGLAADSISCSVCHPDQNRIVAIPAVCWCHRGTKRRPSKSPRFRGAKHCGSMSSLIVFSLLVAHPEMVTAPFDTPSFSSAVARRSPAWRFCSEKRCRTSWRSPAGSVVSA